MPATATATRRRFSWRAGWRRGSNSYFLDTSALRTRLAICFQFEGCKSHSHIRMTFHPCFRKVRVTRLSRSLFRPSLAAHHPVRVFGSGACFGLGHPCQKQPSTKIATRLRRKVKSGLPKRGCLRRQPAIPCVRSNAIIRNSVSLFPQERIRDITSLRLFVVNTSVTIDGYVSAAANI